MDYLTAMKLNTSDDKIIEKFDPGRAELIDSEKGIWDENVKSSWTKKNQNKEANTTS